VEVCENVMYVCVDSQTEPWILRYQNVGGEWKGVQKLVLPTIERKESVVPLYWLESIQKRFRGDDMDE
jgi:hypothetical protein